MYKDYENMEMKRERSRYPRGLKHFAKDELIENTLFDFELIKYKVKGLLKGNGNGRYKKDARTQEADESTTGEICDRYL